MIAVGEELNGYVGAKADKHNEVKFMLNMAM